jgi:hypothetical protein
VHRRSGGIRLDPQELDALKTFQEIQQFQILAQIF